MNNLGLVENLKYFTPNEQAYLVYKYFSGFSEQQICEKLGVNRFEMEIVKIEVGERLNYIFKDFPISERGRSLLKHYKEHPFEVIDINHIDTFVWQSNNLSKVDGFDVSQMPIKAEVSNEWSRFNNQQVINILKNIEKNQVLFTENIQYFKVLEQAIMNFLLGINGFEKSSPLEISKKIGISKFIYFCERLNLKFEMLSKEMGVEYRKMRLNSYPVFSKEDFEKYCLMSDKQRKDFEFNLKDECVFSDVELILKNLTHFSILQQFILLSLNGLNGFEKKTRKQLIQECDASALSSFSKRYKDAKNVLQILKQGETNPNYKKVVLRKFPALTPEFYEQYRNLDYYDKVKFVARHEVRGIEDVKGKMDFIAENLDVLLKNMNHLTLIEQYFVCNAFGINGFEKHSRAEVCEILKWPSSAFSSCKRTIAEKLEAILSGEQDTPIARKVANTNYPILTINNYENLFHVGRVREKEFAEITFDGLVDVLNDMDLDVLNGNMQYFSPYEQYIILRMLGINGFEKFSHEKLKNETVKFAKSLEAYIQDIYGKISIIASTSNQDEIEQNFVRKFKIITLENVKSTVHSPRQIGDKAEKKNNIDIKQQKQDCDALKSKVEAENPEFYSLMQDILNGKDYKIPAIIEIINKNKNLTHLQTEYLIRLYKIEKVEQPENDNSLVLAILLLANEKWARFITKKTINMYNITKGMISFEDAEIIARDSMRKAIEEFDLNLNFSLTTYASEIFKNSLFGCINAKRIIPISFKTVVFKGKTDNLVLEDLLGEDDEYIYAFDENDFKKYVWKCLGYLKPRFQTIMMLYLGKYNEPMSNQQVADLMHLTRSRVASITKGCFEVMREIVKSAQNVKSGYCQDSCRLISQQEFEDMVKSFNRVETIGVM